MSIRMRPLCAAAIAVLLSTSSLGTAGAAPSGPTDSRIVEINVMGSQLVGTYEGVAYTRTFGTVKGVVDPKEDVVGLGPLLKNARGQFEYTTEFEIIAPAEGQPRNEVILVDSENREIGRAHV